MSGTKNVSNLDLKRTFPDAARYFFALAGLFISLLIIYWPGFAGDWYLDDFSNIHENPNVHLKTLSVEAITKSFYGVDQTHSRFTRPLSYLSLALNYYLGSTDPFGYHVVNFAIHYGSSIFLFLLILNILKLPGLDPGYAKTSYSIALLATFLWATHPIQINAVTYIVQRMAALAGFFTIVSLYCYLKARTFEPGQDKGRSIRNWLYAACISAGICSVASKQNAAMLPISLLLFEVLLIKKAALRSFIKTLVPPVLIFLLLSLYMGGLAAFQASYIYRPFTLPERLMTEPGVILFYIGQLLYPAGSTFALLHDVRISTSLFSPWTTLPAIGLLLSIICGCLIYNRKWPLFSFCYLFFFLNHAIEGSIIPLELIFEHRNYLPSIFFFIPPAIVFMKVVDYFAYSPRIQRLAVAGAVVLMVAQAHTTYTQNTLYPHQMLFWSVNVKAYPDLHRPRHNLAKAMLIVGLEDEAESQMYRSLNGKSGARIHQKYITSYNLGVYYLYKMKYPQALEQFATILRSNPHHLKTLQKTAELYLETGQSEKALRIINKALSHAPKYPGLNVVKGFILLARGKIDAAFSAAQRAAALSHNPLAVAYIMGEGYRLKGDFDEALKYFEKISSMGRDHYAAKLSQAELYYLTDNFHRLDQIKAELDKIVAGKDRSEMLSAYNRRWNFVGQDRMDNIARALQE